LLSPPSGPGAAHVRAIDVNPNTALAAAENAGSNGHGECFVAACSNLLSALAVVALFDVIISEPAVFPGRDRAREALLHPQRDRGLS